MLPRLLAALPEADVEIVETHHRGKKDAPSGTAEALAEVVIRARGELDEQRIVYGREGISPRQPGEIGDIAKRYGVRVALEPICIAQQFSTTPEHIREMNRLNASTPLKSGDEIMVPAMGAVSVSR